MLDTVMRHSHCLVVAAVCLHNRQRLNLGFGCACRIQAFRLLVPSHTWKGGHLFLVKADCRAGAPCIPRSSSSVRYQGAPTFHWSPETVSGIAVMPPYHMLISDC